MKNNNNINKHYEDQQQQEDWLRFQELRKHSGMSGGLGVNQFNNMFNSKLVDCYTRAQTSNVFHSFSFR